MHFLTQKIAYGAACAHLGITQSAALNEEGEPIVNNGKLALGNLEAARDWGHARDYVRAMWLMLQQAAPSDYVIGTGRLRTVRDLCAIAYGHVGRNWQDHVASDRRFMRLAETGATVADATKASRELQWRATTTLEELMAEMTDAQIKSLSRLHTHAGRSPRGE
jgi:GDPmannose 4,6-dehydratase